jgi:hypothetical protein
MGKLRRYRRHPAEVTADRLGGEYERWFDRLSGTERDAVSQVRNALQRIAEEDEANRPQPRHAATPDNDQPTLFDLGILRATQ